MNFKKSLVLLFALMLLGAGNAELGKQKTATCIACHGSDGNSMVDLWPSLAGQNFKYLKDQLVLIQSGKRAIPEMMGMLENFDESDLEDIAAYYSNQSNQIGQVSKELVEQGLKLYYAGNFEKGIPACTACHSPRGRGNSLAGYPLLSGQKPGYLEKTLKEYRLGERHYSEQSAIMVSIAYKLDDKEIEALSSFMNGLH